MSSPLKACLTLETLGERVVPAAYTWTGAVSTDAGDFRNWAGPTPVSPPTPGMPGGMLTPMLPGASDDIYFNGSGPGNCNGLVYASSAFASMHIQAGYTGTVSLGGAITLGGTLLPDMTTTSGNLDFASGAIAQDGMTQQLTVNGVFTWTGGVLNSSGNESCVSLNGGGSITLPTGGLLTCGDSIDFGNFNPNAGMKETAITGAGALYFTFGSSVTIEASTVTISANAGETVEFTGPPGSYDDGKAKIVLNNGGGLIVRTKILFDANFRRFVNNGGNLEIKEEATVSFGRGGKLGDPVGTPIVTDILQNSGTISIHSGCTLTSTWGAMEVKGGTLLAVIEGGAASTISTIGCQFNFSGGTMRVTPGFGAFKIEKDFYWTGGTFQATVDLGAAAAIDQILVEKKMFVGGTATLQLLTINFDPLIGLPNNFRQMVIRAKGGIAGIGNLAPSLTLQNPPSGAIFQLNLRPGGDFDEYNLTKG